MSNSVAASPEDMAMVPRGRISEISHYKAVSLYTPVGERKYVNMSERVALLAQLAALPKDRKLFVLMLVWTGARVSEVLELTAHSFQIDSGIVAIRTLKRRGHVIREVPIPASLMERIEREFGIRDRQAEGPQRLWPFRRETAWRTIKRAMTRAGIHGVRATPRGLRHAFGVNTLAAGMPLNLVQRMLGHSSLTTTAIYTQATGPEERAFMVRFWSSAG